ncbi:hypothetical protein J4439_05670 [Candidatus Woesearchaeota archaeon]|nr:hypothetical protein [Candidatus Woesearchaeota archaeon]
MPDAIVTVPPHASFITEVACHPLVSGLRLNTVMPVKGSLEDTLKRLLDTGKTIYVDLKCRQLRVRTFGVPPFTEIELTHRIAVETPVTAYFSGGKERATVLEVDGNRLIMAEGPHRVVGPGESVNIPHPSLRVEGYLTELDRRYIEAGARVGVRDYMLSFVESGRDITELTALLPEARVVAKIESARGLGYIAAEWDHEARLMAARGDLYLEVERPHHIAAALDSIIRTDASAIVASRLFDSMALHAEPESADIMDADALLRMGYRTFMLGDEVCLKRESVLGALNLLEAVAERYA